MSLRRFLAVLRARNLEFMRDRSTLIWNIAFPVILIAGFALIFGNSNPVFKVGILSAQDAYVSQPQVTRSEQVGTIPYVSQSDALAALRRHQVHLVLDVDQRLYWINETSREGQVLEELLAFHDPEYRRRLIGGLEVRYVDWAMPGVLAMNIMFACLFGVGYVLVRYRKNGVLKRLRATPLSTLEFLAAHMASRLVLVMAVSAALLLGGMALLDIVMVGSFWLLAFIGLLGTLCLISLGLLIATRSRSEELTGGLINFSTWPMIFLSGAWFSIEGAPYWLQLLAEALPLTHIVEAARMVMLDAASLAEVQYHLSMLALMAAVFLSLGVLLFNWESDHR
ncbi:MAG: ABC transporter permease [Natronospirillum sp.]|uniref:ABC transporter permease n=1 Tax=Natronospirillum sp. TaxID=2812955 RepID=UPI0025EF4910|nr:ABC transporter permease [Natronospirillum sp.]MCH8552663.1 ABC transporter permease [Natronospirillum sp.]